MTPLSNQAQDQWDTKQLWKQYAQFKESKLEERRFSHQQVLSLLGYWEKKGLPVETLGTSYEGREIKVITWGKGPVDVLMWTQMHGNEATATRAVFDLLNYLDQSTGEIETLKTELKLHIIPMLNPDGAQLFQRRTTQGIDMNRDALALQCPESKILKDYRDRIDAEFAFNLHDQNIYYNVAGTSNPATISFLAPAFNVNKEVNQVRQAAMQVIAVLNQGLQQIAPHHIGKYDDTFEPRAFGDNMQKWGSSTILIESGGYVNDPEKQQARALNFVSLVIGLQCIAGKSYQQVSIEDYWQIPDNHKNLHDLMVRNIKVNSQNTPYQMDLAIRRTELDHNGKAPLYYHGSFEDTGDLSTQWGYEEFDAQGLDYAAPKVYPQTQDNVQAAQELDLHKLLAQGYTAIRVAEVPTVGMVFPLDILGPQASPHWGLTPDEGASFIMLREGVVVYAVINGFLQQIESETELVTQGRIFK